MVRKGRERKERKNRYIKLIKKKGNKLKEGKITKERGEMRGELS